MKLHPNSLTIPRTELPNFFGSPTIAKEFARSARPVRNRKRCVCFDREEAMAWYRAEVLAKRD